MVTEDEQMSAALDEHPDLVERFKAGDVTALVELMEAVLNTKVGAVERKVIDKDPTAVATVVASLGAAVIHLENANKEATELLVEWLECRDVAPAKLRDRTWKWLGSTDG